LGGIVLIDSSSNAFTITKSNAGSLNLTQQSAGILQLAMQGVGDIKLLRDASNLGNIDIVNLSTGGNINLLPDGKTTSTKDIEFTDNTHGVVMPSRAGTKKFRIYISADDGTIMSEEV
jgi:hypothetical protein